MAKREKLNDEVNTDTMCRLCLTNCDVDNSLFIFDANNTSLTVRIMACAGLEVTEQDSLPKQICFECRLQLEKSFLFRHRSKNSDSKLRRHFRLINIGKESRVFDESEDEFEEDYSESLKVIRELEEKLAQKQEEDITVRIQDAVEKETRRIYKNAKAAFDGQLKIALNRNKSRLAKKETVVSKPATRSSKRQNTAESIPSTSTEYGTADAIEILVEDMDDPLDDGINDPLISADSTDDGLDEPFAGTDSNEESNIAVYESIDRKPEVKHITRSTFRVDESGEIEPSDDSMEQQSFYGDDAEYLEDSYQDDGSCDVHLDSLLPTIKQSIAEKSGIHLDNDTQYKMIKKSGSEIEVECITSDGRVFNIEMMIDPQSKGEKFERDDNGDLKIFSCTKCPKTFSRRGKLINHERDHSVKSNGQECPYCQKWFPSNSTLQRHIRVHTGEKPFKCEVCNRSFIQKEILKRHVMIHSGERPFKCSACPKSFILKEALRQHFNRSHTDNPVPEMHNCPLCSKSFCHSSGLSRHLLVHAGRTFPCDFCQKVFNDKSALKRHTSSIHHIDGKKPTSSNTK